MSPDRLNKLTGIFRTLFNQDDLVLRENLTAKDVAGWDSFNHVNLIIQIEEEFNVRFTTDEISSMQEVGDLMKLLDQKLGA